MTLAELFKTATERPWKRGKHVPIRVDGPADGRVGPNAAAQTCGNSDDQRLANARLIVLAVNHFEEAIKVLGGDTFGMSAEWLIDVADRLGRELHGGEAVWLRRQAEARQALLRTIKAEVEKGD